MARRSRLCRPKQSGGRSPRRPPRPRATARDGGEATVDGVKGEKLDNYGFGLTLGYQINGNLGLTFSYKSTASDNAPDDLQMDVFMISLVSGWHPIIEGSKRLQSE